MIVTLRLRVSWWVRWYIGGVRLMCELTGLEPDMAKVERWVRCGIRVVIEPIGDSSACP